ncbi:exported protein of unknown function [Bradyrhizobium vignae]|uniref:Secreted protein n=1 Tax=Bradyrhizobium vignae TaxID=1549949 RepID=A0A2U3Q8L1_9BRAD|nr:exported protein of unknown function [Bradyrhizobium vignae]
MTPPCKRATLWWAVLFLSGRNAAALLAGENTKSRAGPSPQNYIYVVLFLHIWKECCIQAFETLILPRRGRRLPSIKVSIRCFFADFFPHMCKR